MVRLRWENDGIRSLTVVVSACAGVLGYECFMNCVAWDKQNTEHIVIRKDVNIYILDFLLLLTA